MANTLSPADWLALDIRSGPGRSMRAPVFRAAGIKRGNPWRPVVLDLTAGYGTDAWLLAAAGCHVFAVERHPEVFEALRAAHEIAARTEPDAIARLRLIHADAHDVLHDPNAFDLPAIDTVMIDPMYPQVRKAMEKKPMRDLRGVVGDDADADPLLDPACRLARRRVAVKRPRPAPPLADRSPDLDYEGKGFRYDVYTSKLPHSEA